MKNIIKKLSKYDVISFDIFDTLLLRPFKKPEDLFMYIELFYGKKGFYKERIFAENIFYKKNGTSKEANLNDIYSVMPHFKEVQTIEQNLEFSGLSVNTELKQIYDEAIRQNKKVIIVSDMYLSADFLEKVLHHNQITKYSKLYVSNEVQHRKDRGDMYDYIISDLGVKPNKILHIGDNKSSDYKKAKEHNIHTFLYCREHMTETRYKKFYARNKYSNTVSVITALAEQYQPTTDYWQDFGYMYAGPLAFSYASFIYNTAIEHELTNILFVARDGYLIKQVFNLINKKNIETHYVYAPRVLNYTANLDFDLKQEKQAKIVCDYFGIEVNRQKATSYIEENISLFEKLAHEEKKRTGYADYIKKIVGKNKKIGVVDTISGQLSAQKLIERESKINTVGFYIATIPGRDVLNNFNHIDFFGENIRKKFLHTGAPDLVELIFSAPENPIITLKKGKPYYKNINNKWETIRHEVYSKIEKGVMKFVFDLMKRLDSNFNITPETVFELLNLYVQRPNSKDIQEMFRLKRSPYADNSLYLPIFSAPYHFWQLQKIKQLLWKTKIQKIAMFVFNPIKIKIRGVKSIKLFLFPFFKKNIFQISMFEKYGLYIGVEDK